jgi:hypothetical protein
MNRIRKVNGNYFIRKGKCFEKVNGVRINRGDLHFFIHRFKGKFFVISEASSGLRVTKIKPTSKKAVTDLDNTLSKIGEIQIKKLIREKIGRNSLSPRYRFIVNPVRNVETCKN